ncbi:MAG: biotin/lipoyl-containing protein [bacterium]
MSNRVAIATVPQLGVNDDHAVIMAWHAEDRALISLGTLLCTLETTKAVYEVHAEESGILLRLAPVEAEVRVSQPIALIGPDLAELEVLQKERYAPPSGKVSEGLGSLVLSSKATRKAAVLAVHLGVRLDEINIPGIIRERDVLDYAARREGGTESLDQLVWDFSRIPVVVYGAGRGAVTMSESLDLAGKHHVACFVDDNPQHPVELAGRPVFHSSKLETIVARGVRTFAVAISIGTVRIGILHKCLGLGLEPVNVIHPMAFVSRSVKLGSCNYIKAGAIVETNTMVGDGCLIDNGAIVAHDCTLEDACHLAPGCSLGSSVIVGRYSIVGIGVHVATGTRIGAYSILSVGAGVVRDVPDHSIVEGVPGRVVGKRKSTG